MTEHNSNKTDPSLPAKRYFHGLETTWRNFQFNSEMNQREKSPLLNLERNSETNDSPNTIKVGGKQNICYFDNDFEGSLCGADKEVSE